MENIYHRYLDLPFTYPKPERFNQGSDQYTALLDQEKVYQPFKEWISSFGLSISNVLEGFYTPPNGGRVPLHADTSMMPGENDICKLNFTWGSLDSTTQWYRIKDISKIKKHYINDDIANKKFHDAGIVPDIDISYVLFADWDDAELMYETVIDRPSLLNISQLHSTFNPSPTEHRWTLCFTLLKDDKALSFDEALEIFKDYIINEDSNEL
jgi:hypothetical protein